MTHALAPFARLRLPVTAAPLFIISTPALVIAQCRAPSSWRGCSASIARRASGCV